MEFRKVGEFKENVLDSIVDINPKEQAPQFVLDRLNYLIGFLYERSPDNLDAFTKNLEKRYQKLIKTDYIKENDLDLSDVIAGFDNVAEYPTLLNAVMNYYFQILDFSKERSWDENVVVVNRNYHQSFLHPRYYNLLTLIETVGREKAISLWKRFFTEFVIYDRVPPEKPFVDLETWLAERNAAIDEDNPSEWVVIRRWKIRISQRQLLLGRVP